MFMTSTEHLGTVERIEAHLLFPIRSHLGDSTEPAPSLRLTSLEGWLNDSVDIIYPEEFGLTVEVESKDRAVDVFTLGTDCTDPRNFFKYSDKLYTPQVLGAAALLPGGRVMLSLGKYKSIWGFEKPTFTDLVHPEHSRVYYWPLKALLLTGKHQLDEIDILPQRS